MRMTNERGQVDRRSFYIRPGLGPGAMSFFYPRRENHQDGDVLLKNTRLGSQDRLRETT